MQFITTRTTKRRRKRKNKSRFQHSKTISHFYLYGKSDRKIAQKEATAKTRKFPTGFNQLEIEAVPG
jgi:hypothetical protein